MEEINAIAEEESEWIAITYDTGASVTVFPTSRASQPRGATDIVYKFASGDTASDYGAGTTQGVDERGATRVLSGRYSEVHKILASGGVMAKDARQDRYLGHDGGYLFSCNSDIGKYMRASLQRAFDTYGYEGTIPVHLERGVYKFYVRNPAFACASLESSSSSGGARGVQSPAHARSIEGGHCQRSCLLPATQGFKGSRTPFSTDPSMRVAGYWWWRWK